MIFFMRTLVRKNLIPYTRYSLITSASKCNKNIPGIGKRFISKNYFNLPENNQNLTLYSIIGTNILVFLAWQQSKNDWRLYKFMLSNFTTSKIGVYRFQDYHTLITAFFSHQDLSHLLFNMLAFYSFGQSTIFLLGTSRFLLLYLGGGLISSICHVSYTTFIPKTWPSSRQRIGDSSPGLGASGAVNAVVIWNIISFPRNMIYLYGILPVPAALLGLGFIAMDGYSLYYGDSNIGNAAHLGGAAYGALFYALTRRIR